MKKLYFWSRLNFSKYYFIPQKLGKFRQHWSSQKSRSEVDDVKDRVIKWSLFDIVYFINFESPFCTISLKNITFIFTAYFQKVFEFWKKNYSSFLIQPQNFLPQSALWATFEAPFLDASTLLSCCTQIHPFTKKAFKGH